MGEVYVKSGIVSTVPDDFPLFCTSGTMELMNWLKRCVLIVLCILPWVIAGCAFAWVMAKHFPADGKFTMRIPVDGRSPWFEAFLPGQRASSPGRQPDGWTGQRITDDPVYARLRLPGAYDQADIRVEFRPNNQPLLELGVARGTAPSESFELSPLWSQELASSTFERVMTPNGPWWIRPNSSRSPQENTAEANVFWHATGTIAEAWMDHGPLIPQTVSSSLRGTHDYWFVPVDGRVDLSLVLQDMNRSAHHSTATFRLMRDQELIWSDAVSFGGENDAKPSALVTKAMKFSDLKPGVYRLSVLSDDSIFIRSWTTDEKRWVIGPRVYFADEVGYSTSTKPVSVWTNSHHLDIKTLHPEGLQTVLLGNNARVAITQTHQTFTLNRDATERQGDVRLSAPKGNVWTSGDGYISWSRDALFYPSPRRLTDETHLDDEAIDAVATTYEAPISLGDGWYASTFRVALDPSQDRLKLVLSAPGVAKRNASVDIRAFDVTYIRPSLREDWWQPFKRELIRAWQRW